MTKFYVNVYKVKSDTHKDGFYYAINENDEASTSIEDAWFRAAHDVHYCYDGEYVATLSNTSEDCTSHGEVDYMVELLSLSESYYKSWDELMAHEENILEAARDERHAN